MCGIAGAISTSSYNAGLDSIVKLATTELIHRGPDGSGQMSLDLGSGSVAVLGHTRLAIIDLTEAGLQPFVSRDSEYVLTFNGEIYNYLELRKELEASGVRFQSSSDTEVLLYALITWGHKALDKLEGMFAFVFIDKKKNSILFARDPFGIKPLYYHVNDSMIGFASEPRALRKMFPALNKIDKKVASDYLVFGYHDKGSNTFFEKINSLLPGHYMQFDMSVKKQNARQEKYWHPNLTVPLEISFDEAQKRFRELFFESIELHMRSDVAVGAALSGGLDSSSVVSAVRHLYPSADLHTFSYIASDPKLSEESWVDQVNSFTGATGHKVSIDKNMLFERDLDELVFAQGEPFPSLSIYAQFKVFQLAKETGIKVTLDGQGADEFLAGYFGYPEARIASQFNSGDFLGLLQFANNWRKWPGRSIKNLAAGLFSENLPSLRQSPLFMSIAQGVGLMGRNDLEFFSRQALQLSSQVSSNANESAESKRYKKRKLTFALLQALGPKGLTSLLRVADRNSMHSSIESRVPFLNRKLVEFTLALPENYLISDRGETKHILRKALTGIVPEPILNRKDKIGFEAATPGWGKGSAVLSSIAKSFNDVPLIESAASRSAIESVVSGERALDSNLWRVVNFSRWYQLENLVS